MKWLRYIVIALGAVGFILAALTVLLFNRPKLGWQALSVPTGSMRPAMQPGSLVLTHRVPIRSLKVGEVITHTNPLATSTTLTHRIVKVYKIDGKIPAFVTKGDANPSPDPPVVGGLVQGRMVWHVPYAGELLMWAKTWAGIAVLIYLPALLIMTHETRLLAVYLRKMKPYRLEGSAHVQPRGPKPVLRPKWVAAAGAVFVIAAVVTGWQAAGALAGQPVQMLLTLTPNEITANVPVSVPPPAPAPAGADTPGSNTTVTNPGPDPDCTSNTDNTGGGQGQAANPADQPPTPGNGAAQTGDNAATSTAGSSTSAANTSTAANAANTCQ
ncbi:MAG TPA: signal peptidase I [Candidatus Saccharimonadales bacterium]|jgi:signal peptidase I